MEQPENDSRKLWWLVALMLAMMSALVATNLYLLLGNSDPAAAAENPEPAEEAQSPPAFVEIEPFTVNLRSDEYGSRLLYAGMVLRVNDEEAGEFLEDNRAEMRSHLITLISGQEADDLISEAGKAKLVAAIRKELQVKLQTAEQEMEIRDVYFTEFIVQ